MTLKIIKARTVLKCHSMVFQKKLLNFLTHSHTDTDSGTEFTQK